MFKAHRVALFAVVLPAAATIGCQKHVELRINNLHAEPITVELRAPGIGWENLGPIPSAGMLKYDLKIDNDDLPAQCSASDGKQKLDFMVTKETDSPQYIDFKPWGPPLMRDKHTKVHEKVDVKIKKVPIRTEEVIE